MKSQNFPAGGVREATVLYLTSRLNPPGVIGKVVGKPSPSSIELSSTVFYLCLFILFISVDPSARGSYFELSVCFGLTTDLNYYFSLEAPGPFLSGICQV